MTEHFRPENMLDEALQAPLTGASPLAPAPLAMAGVSVVDESGIRLLDAVTFTLLPGERVAVVGPSGGGKDIFAQLLARLASPSAGRITWGDQDLARLSESAFGARASYVGPAAYVFSASVRDNLVYGLKQRVVTPARRDEQRERARQRWLAESRRAGNSDLDCEASWVDLESAGIEEPRALDARLLSLLASVDLADDIYNLGLRGRIDPAKAPERAASILAARSAVAERLRTPELKALVEPFDAERYNTNATIAENLLFGTPTHAGFEIDALATNAAVTAVLDRTELTPRLVAVGRQVAATMVEIFADLPAGHELFEQYSFLSADELAELPALLGRVGADGGSANPADRAKLLSLPLKLVDARHRLGVIDDALKERILAARKTIRSDIGQGVAFFDADRYNAAATILDNILFGKIAYGQARAEARVGKLIAETLDERGLRGSVLEAGLDFQVGVAGARLSAAQRQKLALARGLAKRPALKVVNEATAALDSAAQARVIAGVLASMGTGSLVWVMHADSVPAGFDRIVTIAEGRVARVATPPQPNQKPPKAAD
ncbi:MAG: ATP-binding cassette domain-containing protein [Alphaproteobacteria bacterium]|nr:ATP-binding cassette domain-containing protein [Alphaproteobacteria bacterium]